MFWLRHENKSFNKSNKINKITQETDAIKSSKTDFKIALRHSANLEIDDGSGYGIAKIYKLEDMI